MKTPDPRRVTAIHEAGHAVLAVILDLGAGSVTIESDGVSAGIAHDDGDHPRDEDAEALYMCAPEAFAMRHATTFYAGAHAVRRAGFSDWMSGADQDYRSARHLAYDLTACPSSRDAIAKLCERRAEILVDHYWPEIEAVAAALLERSTIDGDELRRIVRESVRARAVGITVW
jgi:ATP-dependent Zn protease